MIELLCRVSNIHGLQFCWFTDHYQYFLNPEIKGHESIPSAPSLFPLTVFVTADLHQTWTIDSLIFMLSLHVWWVLIGGWLTLTGQRCGSELGFPPCAMQVSEVLRYPALPLEPPVDVKCRRVDLQQVRIVQKNLCRLIVVWVFLLAAFTKS